MIQNAAISRDDNPVFCADIGGSFIKFAISPSPGVVTPLERVATPASDWEAFVTALSQLIERHSHLIEPNGDGSAPLALSITGIVDPRTGISIAANIPCITGRPVAAELSAQLGRPVVAANDADCLTLAEANDGAGRGHEVVFCAIIGTGIGGGLAVDGVLVRGAGGGLS